MGDSHIYLNHIDALNIQLQRKPRTFPKLTINREVNNISDFKYDDFSLDGYNPYPKISMEMAIWKGSSINVWNERILIKQFILNYGIYMLTIFKQCSY